MWRCDFQFYAELEAPDGARISDVRLDVDWIPALRWADFEQTVRRRVPKAERHGHPAIEPIWMPEGEPPYLCGVTIRSGADGAEPLEVPLSYFVAAVLAASTSLVDSGVLEAGQEFDYKIYALSDGRQAQPGTTIDVVAVDETPAIESRELAPLIAGAESTTPDAAEEPAGGSMPEPMPIVIPERVLEEAMALAATAGDVETGGILLGRLCRDPDGTVFTAVTAQIPAEHTTSTRESLRFTPKTWVSVDAALKLRNQNETTLGWWHSHPFFCRNCTPLERSVCPFSKPVFSAADRDVHREVFQQPWNVALLLSFLGDTTPSYDVFAWNRGRIEAVKFTTVPDTALNRGVSH